MRGCVLMASYNESRAIAPVLAEIDEAARALRPSGIELDVVLLDEGSADGTADVAAEIAKHLELDFEVIIAAHTTVGQAMLTAFAHVLADEDVDFIVTLDADGQHDGRQIPDLVRTWIARGSGITIGSRWVRGGSSPGTGPARSVLSRAGNLLVRRVTGVRGVRDSTTSFRVYRPDVARLLTPEVLRVDGYGFYSAVVAVAQAHGFTIDEVPITFRPRYSGVRKLAGADLVDFAKALLTTRRQVNEIRRDMRSNQAKWAQRSARLRAAGHRRPRGAVRAGNALAVRQPRLQVGPLPRPWARTSLR
jgi:dolichol-phosphate mannosyltransferase